jgi:hypothetical protein
MTSAKHIGKRIVATFGWRILIVVVTISAVLGAIIWSVVIRSWPQLASLAMPDNPTAFWTAVLVLATLALGLVAVFGLYALRLTKKDMRDRALREARANATERCVEFAKSILNNYWAIRQAFREQKVQLFVSNSENVVFGTHVERDQVPRAVEWIRKLPGDLSNRAMAFMNNLEWWAMYFRSGLAGCDVAAEALTPIYCEMIMLFYPLFIEARARETSGNFPSCVWLFDRWHSGRMDAHRAAKVHSLVKQLMELEQGGPRKDPEQPIGYE